MAEKEKEEAEQLKKHGDVKEALAQTTAPPEAKKKLPTKKTHRLFLGTYAVLLLVFLAIWILFVAAAAIAFMRQELGVGF